MFGFGRPSCFTARFAAPWVAIGLSLTLGACGSSSKQVFQRSPDVSREEAANRDQGSMFGKGLNLFSSSKSDASPEVAVNAFLWRAALDTVAFMPLASADPFGGIIITDWYSLPESPDERFKVNVYILGRALRADGLKVSVFRQTRGPSGAWSDTAVGPEVNPDFEDAVLSRARELRLQAVNEKG
ncbi:MAG: DUF3576 domain-containing protein [Rhodospirillaceae bacterium]|nr:MAG: DUF3576 domain-containing protein [Rhodospirillaceae bacterium]